MKTKWFNRVLAIAVALCLVTGMVPGSALATSADDADDADEGIGINEPSATGDTGEDTGTNETSATDDPAPFAEPNSGDEITTEGALQETVTDDDPTTVGEDSSSPATPVTEEDDPTAQAETDGDDSTTPEEALRAAVANGGTVTLDENITLTATLTIEEDTVVILDLNGHTLTGTGDDTITNNGTLTIEGTGTITNTADGKTALLNNGTAILNGGTFIRDDVSGNSYYTVVNHGTMTVDGATISNTGSYASCVENGWYNLSDVKGVAVLTVKSGMITGGLNAVKNDNSSELYVEGGTIQNSVQYAVMNYGVATISGGEISCTVSDANVSTSKPYAAIYNHNSIDDPESTAQLNITGGTVTCNNHGVYSYSGNVIISGAAKVTGGVYAVYSAGSMEISGDAELSGGSSGISSTGSDAVLEISGGTITGGKYYAITLGSYSDTVISGGTLISEKTGANAYVVRLSNASVEITGGTFGSSDSNNKATVYVGSGSTADISGGVFLGAENNIYTVSGVTATVTGGTFSTDVNQYVSEGYEYDSTTGEVIAATPVDTYVAEVNGTKYTTLTEAVAAVQADGTITLLADVTNKANESGEADNVINIVLPAGATLDGDGHTLEGNIKVTVNAAGGTIQNVNFKNIHNNANSLSAVYGSSLSGTLTVTGCTFHNCDWDALQITPVANANITITGNTFSTDNTDGINQVRYVHIQSKTNVDFSATVTENVMYDTIKGVNGAGLKCGALEIYYFTNPEKITTNMNYIEYPELNCILMNSGTNVGEMVYPMYATDDLEEDNLITPVAAIKTTYEGTYYTTLQEAIDAAGNRDTITLLANVTESVTVPADKVVTLDLNGKTLTNEAGKDTITVALGAELTVTGNGTVDNVSHQMAAVVNNGTTTLNGGSYTRSQEASTSTEDANGNSYYNILNHGVMTINEGVSVTSTGAFSSLIDNGYYSYSSTNPRSGYVEGVNQAKPSLTINGGTFSGGINTIKNDDAATVKITGGSFSNVTQHVVLNWNIASIEGGTFDSSNGASVTIQNNGDSNNINQGKLTITGGTFTASEGTSNLGGSGGTIAVSGGTFSSEVPENYCADGFEPVTVADENGMYTVQETVAAVAQIGEKTYPTLDKAIEAVQPGETITLLGNVTLADDAPAKIVDKGTAEKPITLNLNGYTISGSNSKNNWTDDASSPGGILWLSGSYVTLTDTSDGEKGSIINTSTASTAIATVFVRSTSANGGHVVIDGGVNIISESASATSRAIYFYKAINTNEELLLDIENAVVLSGGYTISANVSTSKFSGLVTINGGEFTSTGMVNDKNAISGTDVKINGGTFHSWYPANTTRVADGKYVCVTEEDSVYTVTVVASAPADYIAKVKETNLYLLSGNLYALHVVTAPQGKTIEVVKSTSYTFPDGKFFGQALAEPYALTLELAGNVTLSGGMTLQLADVTVTGEGALAEDFAWTPYDATYEMIETDNEALHSCRLKSEAMEAWLVKADGTTLYYPKVYNALYAGKGYDGCTVYLNRDAELTQTISNLSNGSCTIDLNGHTLTFTGSKHCLEVTKGHLTVKNSGTEGALVFAGTGSNYSAIIVQNSGSSVTIEEGAVVKGTVTVTKQAEATIAGTVDVSDVTGCYYAVAGNGTTGAGDTKITIKNTAVIKSGSDVAIFHPQSGTLTVEGGTISGYGGIQMCSGDLVITGDPTITATGSDNTANKTGDGGIPDGAAISIVNRDYPGGTPTVEITGSPTVTATSGVDAVQAYTWSNSEKSEWAEAGDFVNISGGVYSTKPEEALLAEGYVANLVEDESGNYIVEEGDEALNTATNASGTLATLLANATTGQTVKLLRDVTAENILVGSGITLDLNGQTLEVSEAVTSFGQVKDSSNGTGVLVTSALTLSESNEQLPIFVSVDNGYHFVNFKFQSFAAQNGTEESVEFWCRVLLEDAETYNYLKSNNAHGLKVSMHVSVNGYEDTLDFVYTDSMLDEYAESIITSGKPSKYVLYLKLTGLQSFSGATVKGLPKLESTSAIGFEVTAKEITYTVPEGVEEGQD